MPEKWERQKGESRQAFEAFVIYRDMGPKRSLAQVSKKLGKSLTLMQRWSSKWNWVERANAWDDEMDRVAREAQEKERKEMAERHAKTAMLFQKKVLERIQSLRVEELSPSDLVKWFDVSVKIERLARGASTEITEITGKNNGPVQVQHQYDLSKLTVEELRELDAILAKLAESGRSPEDISRKES